MLCHLCYLLYFTQLLVNRTAPTYGLHGLPSFDVTIVTHTLKPPARSLKQKVLTDWRPDSDIDNHLRPCTKLLLPQMLFAYLLYQFGHVAAEGTTAWLMTMLLAAIATSQVGR